MGLGADTRVAGIWPVIATSAGVLLPVLALLHGGRQAIGEVSRAAASFPAYGMHLFASLALLVGGAAESLSPEVPFLALVWPLALLTWGTLFVLQRQHGTAEDVARAMTRHRLAGVALITAGVLRGLGVVLVPVTDPV